MKLMALDGNSLAYRAFFALPTDMATASGQVTNSVYGFCTMLNTLVKDHKPDGVIVVFDRREKTFRHERFLNTRRNVSNSPTFCISS
jgi:DNA polymerase I